MTGRELETKAAQKKLLIACKDGGRAGLDVVDRRTCKELAGCGESWRPREKRKTFDGLDRERRRRRAESSLAVERAGDQGRRGKLSIA
ncbi:hypothetical protein MRB53_025624 [Persea americana]|uniref:Uncharacterized protein n=1 Tax=Persea americana TaxID=3435 RepID=A0ACC2LG30_PERAE|nr:hypothetical protein MRB53_025624 [Persea americana]